MEKLGEKREGNIIAIAIMVSRIEHQSKLTATTFLFFIAKKEKESIPLTRICERGRARKWLLSMQLLSFLLHGKMYFYTLNISVCLYH